MPLALLDHPLGGVSDDHVVVWDGGHIKPEKRHLGEGRIRYTFNADKLAYNSIQWTYHVSNAVALNQAELGLREPRLRIFPNLNADLDAVSHVVRLDSDVLDLTLTFEPESNAAIQDVHPLAERRAEIRGEDTWERIAEEEQRCHVTRTGTATASLKVKAPTIGWRYSLCYKPAVPGQELTPGVLKLGRSVLQKCREVHQSRMALAYFLTQAVADSLAVGLERVDQGSDTKEWDQCVLGTDGAWVGFIWDSSARQLQPAFGQFPPDSWRTSFTAGTGIAGHCLRFSEPVFWHVDSQQETNVIFQASRGSRSYVWIISLPLEVARGGPALGVVSLAGEARRSKIGDRLLRLAEEMAMRTPQEGSRRMGARLATAVNSAFWTVLSNHESLTNEDRVQAQEVFRQLLPSSPGAGVAHCPATLRRATS